MQLLSALYLPQPPFSYPVLVFHPGTPSRLPCALTSHYPPKAENTHWHLLPALSSPPLRCFQQDTIYPDQAGGNLYNCTSRSIFPLQLSIVLFLLGWRYTPQEVSLLSTLIALLSMTLFLPLLTQNQAFLEIGR